MRSHSLALAQDDFADRGAEGPKRLKMPDRGVRRCMGFTTSGNDDATHLPKK